MCIFFALWQNNNNNNNNNLQTLPMTDMSLKCFGEQALLIFFLLWGRGWAAMLLYALCDNQNMRGMCEF